jgi:LL-diaminopimelate aminotransferase
MESFIQEMFAERIGGNRFGKDTVLYKFEKIKRAKREAMANFPGMDLIDMGVGEPDWMADHRIVRKLYDEAKKWENRDYADNGIAAFKAAAAAYMEKVYGVIGLDPETEVIHSIGSKPALAMLPQAFVNPGDVTLMTVPGYPVTGTMTKWLGGEVHPLPLREENNFLPDLDGIPAEIRRRAKLLYINYPNNPTGAVATAEFFAKVVAFAKANQVIVIQDCAYGALTFDGHPPLSFLSVPGAKDVGVEVHSLSKAFNMTGWRLGFLAGNEKIIKAFGAVKDNNDSGQFKAIQMAGAFALAHPDMTDLTAKKYSRRHDLLVGVLQGLGFKVRKPRASFYLYVQAPKGLKNGPQFETAEDFSQWLIREKLISTVPWDDVGRYVRFSVTFIAEQPEDEARIMDEIKSRLGGTAFEWN